MTAGKQKNMVVKMVQRILDRQFILGRQGARSGEGNAGNVWEKVLAGTV